MTKFLKTAMLVTLSVFMTCMIPVTTFAMENGGFKQSDPQWKDKKMGELCTLADSGCLVTSIATLMVQSGVESEDDFTPATLLERLENGGFISHDASSKANDGNLNYGAAFSETNSPEFYLAETRDYTYTSFEDLRKEINQLCTENRYYAVVGVKYNGHWVPITDPATDDLTIGDPAKSGKTTLREYDGGILTALFFCAPNQSGDVLEDLPAGDATRAYGVGITGPGTLSVGQVWSLTGTVYSPNLNPVVWVTITDANDNVVMESKMEFSGKVDLGKSSCDYATRFNDLPAGEYMYHVGVVEYIDDGESMCYEESSTLFSSEFVVK